MQRALVCLLAVASFALAFDARARLPDVPPRAAAPDESPTAFACSKVTLLEETDCTLEAPRESAHDPARQARDNAKAAASLAPDSCAAVSRSSTSSPVDSQVLDACVKAFRIAATACTLDGRVPLFDDAWRFVRGSDRCYGALASVLRRARVAVRLASECCRCLASACSVAVGECHSSVLGSLVLPESASACPGRSSCTSPCAALAPRASEPEPDGSSKSSKTRKTTWL